MTQSSEKIAQQYIDGGVVPAALVGQDAATKTYVDGQLELRDERIDSTIDQIATNKSTMDMHIADTTVHVTTAEKLAYNNHIADTVIHTTQAEHDKLASIQAGAQVNQNAFAKVNSLSAANTNDEFFIVGDIGITVTTNPITKEVRITATGSSAPGAHASTHITGGTDVIPDAVTDGNSGLMSGTDARFVRVEGETKSGAQSKADAAQTAATTALNTHANTIVNSAAAHGLRINSGTLEYYNGTVWVPASSQNTGPTYSTQNMNYYVNTSTGNDSNTGLDTGQAFKTIAKAVSMIPYILNQNVIINVAAGTYTEDITIEEKTGGGWVRVTGPSGGGFILNGKILVQRCTLSFVSLMYITVNTPAATIGVSISYVIRLIMSNITMTTSNGQPGVSLFNSTADVSNSTISNRASALFAQGFSQLFSNTNTGSGNTVGMQAITGSTIVKSGSQPAGTTAEVISGGGLIRS